MLDEGVEGGGGHFSLCFLPSGSVHSSLFLQALSFRDTLLLGKVCGGLALFEPLAGGLIWG